MEAGDRMLSFHTSSPCVPLLGKEREEREKEVEKINVPILSNVKDPLNSVHITRRIPPPAEPGSE